MANLVYKKINEYLGLNKINSKKPVNKKKTFLSAKKSAIKDSKKKMLKKIAVWTSVFFGSIGLIGIVGFGILVYMYSKELPSPGKPFTTNSQKTNIYDRNGVLITSLFNDTSNREIVDLKDISPYMRMAMIGSEDVNFYNEPGVDVFGIIRAAINDVFNKGERQGGSTISQQLVKNAITQKINNRTMSDKIKELILTFEMEHGWSKDEILQAYLNYIFYGTDGNGAQFHGIKVAAKGYFGKEPKDLDLAESIIIASIVNRPSYYDPFAGHIDDLNARAFSKLDNMLKHNDVLSKNGMPGITQKQADDAKAEIKTFKFIKSISTQKYHGFVEYVENKLIDQYGSSKVYSGGLQVTTTIDSSIQDMAEQITHDYYTELNLPPSYKNQKYYNFLIGGNGLEAESANLISIDPKTGEVIAMVGSPDESKANIAAEGRSIQPGSSIKPFVYMLSFKELGLNPKSFMPDIPITIDKYKGETVNYRPSNFGNDFYGATYGNHDLDIDTALSWSRNIPAIEAMYSLDPTKFLKEMSKFGYTTDPFTHPDDPSLARLPIAIGSIDVNFLEHVNGYSVFANQGRKYPATTILKITEAGGKELYKYEPEKEKMDVIDPAYPYFINTILHHYGYMVNELNRFFYKFYNSSGYSIAGKTGTNNVEDANGKGNPSSINFVGYTPNLVTGFWLGNATNSNIPMKGGTGELLIPYWAEYMQKVLPKFNKDKFEKPSDVVDKQICADTGLLYVEGQTKCSPITASFQKDQIPKVDDQHVVKKVCASDKNLLAPPSVIAAGKSIERVIVTLKTFDKYFQGPLDSYLKGKSNDNIIPTEYCSSSNSDYIAFVSPTKDAKYKLTDRLNVSAIIIPSDDKKTIGAAIVFLDGVKMATMNANGNIYSASFMIPPTTTPGNHTITIKAIDTGGTEYNSIKLTIVVAALTPSPTPTSTSTPTSTVKITPTPTK